MGSAEHFRNALIELQQLKSLINKSRSSIYDISNPASPRHDPTFPQRVKVGPRSVRWKLNEVLDWIDSRPRVGEHKENGHGC